MRFGRCHTDAASRSSLRPEERESCDYCQRLATKDVPYPHGSDEGIFKLSVSSFTVVAVVSLSLSVSVEESVVCKMIS
jgi:hypothetical protein